MIRDGALTHSSPESYLSTLQFVSPRGYAVIVAALTTVISYHASAIIFDLFLGLKQHGVAKLSDIFVLHFSTQASVLQIVSEMTVHRSIAHASQIRPRASVSRLVAMKLLFILFSVFAINLLSIILLLESKRQVTFADAGFGGVAVGIPQPGKQVMSFARNEVCNQFVIDFGPGVTNTPEFLVCRDMSLVLNNLSNTVITHTIEKAPTHLSAEIKSLSLNRLFKVTVMGTVRIGGDVYRLRQAVPEEQFQGIWRVLSLELTNICESSSTKSVFQEEKTAERTLLSQELSCKGISFSGLLIFLDGFANKFSLVEADNFDVGREGNQFFRGDDLLLFKRSRPYVGLEGLLAATLGVIILRIGVKLITANDVALGMEMVLKKSLNIGRFDSMLCSRKVIEYYGDLDEG